MKNLRKGFTLVELLVVIAVIGILFVVLISKVDFATDKAKETGVKTDFRSYQLAMEQVAREQTGFAMTDTGVKAGEVDSIVKELNKNLDQKLAIAYASPADADAAYVTGAATIAAEDAWGTEYEISFAPALDHDGEATTPAVAAVVFTSAGSDKLVDGDNDGGGGTIVSEDDITITTFYGPNGVESFTTGLSNNIEL